MIGYSATDVFSRDALDALRWAEAVVDVMPERVDGEVLRCHEVARAVWFLLRACASASTEKNEAIYRSTVVDGRFGYHDHSWIALEDATRQRGGLCVLDPYAIGRLPTVQLVDQDCLALAYHPSRDNDSPWRYRVGPERRDVRWDVVASLVLTAIDEDWRGRDALRRSSVPLTKATRRIFNEVLSGFVREREPRE